MALRAGDIKVGESWDLVLVEDLKRTQIVQYAGASGDYNPLHTDEIFATKVAGYPSVFAHGMLTMGMTGRILTDRVGDGRLTKFGGRFTSQVFPGDTLTATATVTDVRNDEADFTVRTVNQDGIEVFSGTATARLDPYEARSLGRQFRGSRADRDCLVSAQHLQFEGPADGIRDHQLLKVAGAVDGRAVDGDDRVGRTQAGALGRAARRDFHHAHAGRVTERRRMSRCERAPTADDTEVGTSHPTGGHQRTHDAEGRGVDGDCHPETDAGDRRVDPDQARPRVHERSTRVAGVEGGIGLDHVLDDAASGRE